MPPPCPPLPSAHGVVPTSPQVPRTRDGWAGRGAGSQARAGDATPQGDMGHPTLGSVRTSRGDRNGYQEQSGCQPRGQHPNIVCLQGTSPFPHQGLSLKVSPCMCPPRAEGQPSSGAGSQVGHPQGRGTHRGGGQPHASVAQHYLLLQKDFHKFPKPAGIVIPHGFGIAEGFQQGGRLQDLPQSQRELWGQPGHPNMPQAVPMVP